MNYLNPFNFLLQAYGNDDDKVCLSVTLPLAERMIKKFVDDNKIEAEAEVQLYLMILEKEVIVLRIYRLRQYFLLTVCFSFSFLLFVFIVCAVTITNRASLGTHCK